MELEKLLEEVNLWKEKYELEKNKVQLLEKTNEELRKQLEQLALKPPRKQSGEDNFKGVTHGPRHAAYGPRQDPKTQQAPPNSQQQIQQPKTGLYQQNQQPSTIPASTVGMKTGTANPEKKKADSQTIQKIKQDLREALMSKNIQKLKQAIEEALQAGLESEAAHAAKKLTEFHEGEQN